jgi:hypothetical protein
MVNTPAPAPSTDACSLWTVSDTEPAECTITVSANDVAGRQARREALRSTFMIFPPSG